MRSGQTQGKGDFVRDKLSRTNAFLLKNPRTNANHFLFEATSEALDEEYFRFYSTDLERAGQKTETLILSSSAIANGQLSEKIIVRMVVLGNILITINLVLVPTVGEKMEYLEFLMSVSFSVFL